ncbi:XrtA system polysaccharide chain length determinant [Novosphingobium sp. Gsoil 351]|uniref:XrtA system polysaccharide chain length determinant n=1 Tax=Novosphingobium sp. Gsoil 351 TaxID=2675225 RepID=UPI0012B47710|nr:XrtA system polysaccharide chain length determinant [Novosphingobium sp. Gsoil 351]QGN53206.1 chain-length determining protein [Novosphingobium sp. Gsoil 351]
MNPILTELRVAAYGAWQRRWLALGIAWGVAMLGWLAVAFFPNSYESKARIFVQLDDVLAEQIGIGPNDARRELQRVRQTLTSAVNLEKVVRATRIGETVADRRQMEAAVALLSKEVTVVSDQDNLFEITAVSGDSNLSDLQNSRLAQDIVQKMIDIFREENLSGGRGEMKGTLAFMDQQLENRKRELEAAEQKRMTFEAQNAESIPGSGALAQRQEAARSEMRGIDADIAAGQSALAAIEGQLNGTPATIQVPGGGGIREALGQAQAQLAGLRSRGLTDSHPDVIAARNQIALLARQAAGDRSGGAPNPAYSSLQSIKAERQANLQALLSRRASLQGEMGLLAGRAAGEPMVAAESARINRDYDVLKAQYDKLLQDREELRLRGQVESETSAVKFQVIDPPTTPRKPVAPNRPLLLFAVLVIAIGAGIGTSVAASQVQSSFATAAKLEAATGLPVLGSISQTITDAAREINRRRMKWFAGGSAALGGVFVLLLAVELVQRSMVA